MRGLSARLECRLIADPDILQHSATESPLGLRQPVDDGRFCAHTAPKATIETHFFRRWPITPVAARALTSGRQQRTERRNGGQAFVDRPRGTMTSAIWKVMDGPWRNSAACRINSFCHNTSYAYFCADTKSSTCRASSGPRPLSQIPPQYPPAPVECSLEPNGLARGTERHLPHEFLVLPRP